MGIPAASLGEPRILFAMDTMPESYPHVSIIVPVFNRARTIGRCLQSLEELDYPSYEVIVVDNGSTDDTVEVVSRYRATVLHEKKRGPYTARNTGVEAAQGPLIFFIDSDCVAHKDLLKKLVSRLIETGTAGIGGQLVTHEPKTPVERFEDFAGILQYTMPLGFLEWDKSRFLSGGIFTSNALFWKEAVVEQGNFDDSFRSGGDFDLCWRLQRAGHKLYFDPEATVFHIHRADLKGLVTQFFKYGSEQPHLLKKQPEGTSYLKLKTYLFPQWELCLHSPVRFLVNIDICNLLPFCLLGAVFSTTLLYLSGILFAAVLLGTSIAASGIVKQTGERKWYVCYPFFHIIRNYAFTAGRIYGGIKHRVLSF
jgi:glycosyltransferase involved in cell wall biosynthesis